MAVTMRDQSQESKRYAEIDSNVDEDGVKILEREEPEVDETTDEQSIDPTRPLKCVAWHGVKGCSPETVTSSSLANPLLSLGCDSFVATHLAGWCECEAGFRAKEVGCVHGSFSCAEECSKFTVEDAAWPTEANRLRAELVPTDTVVAEFLHGPSEFAFEFAPAHILEALSRNLPFAIFLLCDCDEDVRWGSAIEDLVKMKEYKERIKGRFAFGFARREGIERFGLLDNFAVEGSPALGIDNIPVGQNMEKYTFRMEQGGQLKHRPDIGQPPPVAVTGEELASFFLSFLDGSLPLSVKSAPAPPLSPAQQNAHQKMLFQQHLQKQQEQQQQRRQLSHPWGSSKTASSGLDERDDGFNSEAVVLVGSTFRNAVLDETKDVAVLFFAPWCPACQLVEPVIDKAAGRVREVLHSKQLESNTTAEGGATEEDVVLVAKMDLTQNDIALRGVSVRHYPSLWLWPRGAKEAPLDYSKYNHEREDAGKLESQHSHYELGMLVDFMTHFDDHRVRHVHTDGGVFDHLFDA